MQPHHYQIAQLQIQRLISGLQRCLNWSSLPQRVNNNKLYTIQQLENGDAFVALLLNPEQVSASQFRGFSLESWTHWICIIRCAVLFRSVRHIVDAEFQNRNLWRWGWEHYSCHVVLVLHFTLISFV